VSNTLQTAPNSPQSGISAESFQDLKRKSVRSGAITFVSQGASIVIQLASTVVLSRLLTPNDYGVMAMVMAVTGFAGLFRDLGLSSAAIQRDNLTHGQASTLFWINVIVGFALTLILAICSPLVAWFYKKPELIPVTLALSSSFVLTSIGSQPNAHLTRDMKFGKIAMANIASALLGLGISIAMAFAGFSYWSLVAGSIATAIISSLMLFISSGFRPGWFQRGTGVRDMLKFGANITAFDFVNYFHRNLDKILIGRFWGTEPLGMYSRAYSLLMFPISNLRGPINAVAFPAMCKLKGNPDQFRSYYRRISSLLAFLSMPVTAFLFVAAKPTVELLLGRDWLGVVPIFSALAIVAFIQPVLSLFGLVCLSMGMGKRYLQLGIFNAIATSIGFLVGARFGSVGVAIGYAIAIYATAYPLLALAFKSTSIRVCDFFAAIAKPAIASIIAVILTKIVYEKQTSVSPTFILIYLGFAFTACYFGIYSILPKGRADLWGFFSYYRAFRKSA
jgi:PST family polysaccharide transporter